MRKLWIVAVLIILLTGLLPSAARAQTVINPVGDTWVDRNEPTANKDDSNLLVCYSNQPVFVQTTRVYLSFSLAGLTYDVDDTVKLRVYVSIPPSELTVGTLALWSTTDAWTESSLTWSTAPTWTTKLDTKPVSASSQGTWVEFTGANLRDFVNSQRTGDGVASFVIAWDGCTTCTQGDIIEFVDRETTYAPPDPENPPELYAPFPTSVTLTSFAGRVVPQGNLLTWETAQERDCLGFHLYRSTDVQERGTRLNGTIIPAEGFDHGAVYQFLDTTALPRVRYYYTLTDVDPGNRETPHGPVPLEAWRVQLPLIVTRR